MNDIIEELIKILKKKKFKMIINKEDEIISMKKSTLCDRLINLLKLMEE